MVRSGVGCGGRGSLFTFEVYVQQGLIGTHYILNMSPSLRQCWMNSIICYRKGDIAIKKCVGSVFKYHLMLFRRSSPNSNFPHKKCCDWLLTRSTTSVFIENMLSSYYLCVTFVNCEFTDVPVVLIQHLIFIFIRMWSMSSFNGILWTKKGLVGERKWKLK